MDPFCGRGTAPFVAQATGRASLGIDSKNPAAWVFAKVKTDPETNVGQLLYRLEEVQKEVSAEDWIATERISGVEHGANRSVQVF